MKKTKNYLKSFWKYYILRKPKLMLTIILTFIVFVMINNIIGDITLEALRKYDGELRTWKLIEALRHYRIGIFVLFIKPIFIYISGLIIIKKI